MATTEKVYKHKTCMHIEKALKENIENKKNNVYIHLKWRHVWIGSNPKVPGSIADGMVGDFQVLMYMDTCSVKFPDILWMKAGYVKFGDYIAGKTTFLVHYIYMLVMASIFHFRKNTMFTF